MENHKLESLSQNQVEKNTHVNSFGVLSKEDLIIKQLRLQNKVKLNEIKKIVIHKKRSLKWNYLILTTVATIIAVFYFLNYPLTYNDKLLIAGIGTITLSIAVFFKSFEYKLIIQKNGAKTIKIKIPIENKNDAKTLVYKANKKIKELSNKQHNAQLINVNKLNEVV
ncbi:hypothetical protein [Flavobacterium sp.]|uniref:hypothetical protein n=1 Tax=Flavobacterium sp. TaxID=239 RepID=UPI0037528F38